MKRNRKNYSPEFKAKVVLKATPKKTKLWERSAAGKAKKLGLID